MFDKIFPVFLSAVVCNQLFKSQPTRKCSLRMQCDHNLKHHLATVVNLICNTHGINYTYWHESGFDSINVRMFFQLAKHSTSHVNLFMSSPKPFFILGYKGFEEEANFQGSPPHPLHHVKSERQERTISSSKLTRTIKN